MESEAEMPDGAKLTGGESPVRMSFTRLVVIITTTVFSFTSMVTAYYMMGIRALLWILAAALFYFVPYAMIAAEFSGSYRNHPGGIYSWLKDSVPERRAFVTTFIWYCGYFIWQVSLFMKLWIPLSIVILGRDISAEGQSIMGIPNTVWLAVMSAVAVCAMTGVICRGMKTVSSMMLLSGIFMFVLMAVCFAANVSIVALQPDEAVSNIAESFTVPSFFALEGGRRMAGVAAQMPYFIFSITAFGGLDTVASLIDRTGAVKRRFPRAVMISAVLIVLLYLGGVMLWCLSMPLSESRATALHLGNLMYGLVSQLAHSFCLAAGLGTAVTATISRGMVVLSAATLFTAYLGLISAISYAPLKSLVQGTPARFWPARLASLNRHGVPAMALWTQAALVVCLIGVVAVINRYSAEIYNQLTYMTNIARALPYCVVAAAFPAFRANRRIDHPTVLIRRRLWIRTASVSVCATVLLAIVFNVCLPFAAGDYPKLFLLIGAPVCFTVAGMVLYRRMSKR